MKRAVQQSFFLAAAVLMVGLTANIVQGQTAISATSAAAARKPDLKLNSYETRYYLLKTDLDQDSAREASLRLDAIVEVYREWTGGLAGPFSLKLPFFMFKDVRDYNAAGGPYGMTGYFKYDYLNPGPRRTIYNSRVLVAAGETPSAKTWRTMQHEGFHQYLGCVIKGQLPVWTDEGLAEYFGEAVFTGDGFVCGALPSWRVNQVKNELGKMKDLDILFRFAPEDWRNEWAGPIGTWNYDQAWSLVHFLIQADAGKYRKQFFAFIRSCSNGTESHKAWVQNFGPDLKALQAQWKKYWKDLPVNEFIWDRLQKWAKSLGSFPDNETWNKRVKEFRTTDRIEEAGDDVQARITVATLTSFLARAAIQKQTFSEAEAFFSAARAGQLKCNKDNWLPPTLLARSLDEADLYKVWAIETANGRPSLVLKAANGKTYVGQFSVVDGKASKVVVAVQEGNPVAKSNAAAGKP